MEMLSGAEIITFNEAQAPEGESHFVGAHGPGTEVALVAPDPAWPESFRLLADLVRGALGTAVLALDHVGSTAVPGLAAKPIIDLDLTVADVTAEADYVPALEAHGFDLVIREPWWYEHRLLRHAEPRSNLHVWSPDCPESARHLIFRDWLRANPADCELYLSAKHEASAQITAADGDVEAYNAHKQDVIREIYARAFTALGLI
jgi:GrpB-like predicted nucleotidyltransferase (UPF0157 family)